MSLLAFWKLHAFGIKVDFLLALCVCHLTICIFFAVAKGVAPAAPSDYIPKLNKNVCYIVAAVLINESGDVLMMQEAKRSCAGQWYLPAGHIEAGETIQQAVEREVMFVLFLVLKFTKISSIKLFPKFKFLSQVLEETGLTMQSTTLIMTQSAEGCWFRFVFTGNAAGNN